MWPLAEPPTIKGMRLEITDDLIDALIDAHDDDDTLVALRAALLRELAEPEDVGPYPGHMMLAGLSVADRHVLELVRRLHGAGFDTTADRLTIAQESQTRLLALSIDEREQILATLFDCSDGLGELRAVLVQEAAWRDREGL